MIDVDSMMVGLYVADSLDAEETAQFERHLQGCADCRAEVRELQEVMAEVASFHEVTPPPGLKASILSEISTTAMLPVHSSVSTPLAEEATEEPGSNVVRPDFGQRRRPVFTWLAAAAAVLAVALGGVAVWQQSELLSVQAADAQRVALLAADDLQVGHTELDGASLTYLVSQSQGEALVTSSSFPDPGENRSWQVWVMEDGVPRSGALVNTGGVIQVNVDDVRGGQALAITNEPRGGSPAPTDDPQAIVEFAKI